MENYKRLFKEISRWVITILGIAFSILPNFINLSFVTENRNILFGFGISLFIIAVLWYLYDLERKFLWSEPEIILTSSEQGEDEYKDGNFHKVARIRVFNNEEMEISRCFATLEVANDIYNQDGKARTLHLIPSLPAKSDRIKWNEVQDMNQNCELTIPPKTAMHIDLADTLGTFHYNLRGGELQTNWIVGSPLHTIKLRIDGYFNDKAMKPVFFEGYIYAANRQDGREAYIKNGRIKRQHEIVADQITYLKMIFKKGEWVKDKEIREYMNIREYAS